MSPTDQQRAVIEALGLSAEDLRTLANMLDADRQVVLVRDLAQAALDELPRHHRYAKAYRRLISWAGNQDAATVKPADIAAWARRAAAEARADTKARHGVSAQETFILATRAAYAQAIRDGAVRHNPAADVALPARPTSRRTALDPDQLAQARMSLLAHSRDPDLDDLVYQLLRETGCRQAGAIRLSRNDLAPVTRTVRLTEKYDKQRWLPVSAHLMHRLLTHSHARHHTGCQRILHRRDGRHLNAKWFQGFAGRIQQTPWAKELGVSAHWLRHTTLTDIERIAGVRVAAAYAGHADGSLGITGIYTKPSPAELRAAHAILFFDDQHEADDPSAMPHLLRRALPAAPSRIDFAYA